MARRIYIVEDNEIMREMLVQFISDLDDMEIAGAAETGEEALEDLAHADVDLFVVDMALPKMNGAEFIEQARQRRPDVPFLVLSAHGENSYVTRARAAGAHGYVLKGNPYELPDAIRRVLDGDEYVSESLRHGAREAER